MCFSAEASFTASAVLTISGIYAVSKTISSKKKSFLMISMVPLMFALQQFNEGLIWIALQNETSFLAQHVDLFTAIYLFFVIFVWPLWAPLSIALFDKKRRNLFLFFALCSLVYIGLALTIGSSVTAWIVVEIKNQALCYANLAYSLSDPRFIVYIALTGLTPLLSSNKHIKVIGVLAFISSVITYFYYINSYLSTWCFFAAIISLYICYAAYRLDKESTE